MHNFDIFSALKECKGLLVEFGGHKHAAGLSIEVKDVDNFREKFNDVVKTKINKEDVIPELFIESEIKFTDLSPSLFDVVEKIAPFGLSNVKPIFYSQNVVSANGYRSFGNNKIKFRAMQDNFVIDAIYQNYKPKIDIIQSGKPFNIAFSLDT